MFDRIANDTNLKFGELEGACERKRGRTREGEREILVFPCNRMLRTMMILSPIDVSVFIAGLINALLRA